MFGGVSVGIPEIVGAILMILVSVIIIGLVTIQDPKGDGLSALAGGSSFLSNNNDRSIDATLGKITKIAAIAFFVVTLVVYVFAK